MKLINVVLLVVLCVFCGCKKSGDAKQLPVEEKTVDTKPLDDDVEVVLNIDQTDLAEVCRHFQENLLNNPKQAYPLFAELNQSVSFTQFVNTRNMLLPKGSDVVSVELLEPTGTPTEEDLTCTYRVESKSDFYKNLKLRIDITRQGEKFLVKRYRVVGDDM